MKFPAKNGVAMDSTYI